ncbi:MAG: MOSC domain-containing protein [Candidatus Helarchaeota archaeon]
MSGIVLAVNISEKKGVPKKNIKSCEMTKYGLKGDSHAGDWHRQVSLLADESIEKMRSLGIELEYGIFAENLTTKGIELHKLPIGTRLKINDVILEVSQIGKECHSGCAIQQLVGKCIMPVEGIFAKVIKPGTVKAGDRIELLSKSGDLNNPK